MNPIGLKVVSLFDGMGCGLTAIKRAGIGVSEYHAFEIDKYAIKVAKKNHPEIIHHGSVVNADFKSFLDIDLLIAGSPCQGFSFAGKQLAFDDPRSKLFFEFVRAKNEMNPKNFLLENVLMEKPYQVIISKMLDCYPVAINSALLSAQNRKRLYWCNWNIRPPIDKNIYLKDIIEHGVVDRDKSYCIDANYFKGGSLKSYFEKSRRQIVMSQADRRLMVYGAAERGRKLNDAGDKRDDINGTIKRGYEFALDGKSFTLTTVQKDNCLAENYEIRKLTVLECERLQTLPDNYTEGVSNSQRYKMIGNGWTVDVIAHILKELYSPNENLVNVEIHQQELF